jgi:hypothetical protein
MRSGWGVGYLDHLDTISLDPDSAAVAGGMRVADAANNRGHTGLGGVKPSAVSHIGTCISQAAS